MKLKRKDLELLMQYLDKEKPEFVELVKNDTNFQSATGFAFRDLEGRDCTIKIFDAQHNITPELTKTMKLYTRLKDKPSGGESQDPGT